MLVVGAVRSSPWRLWFTRKSGSRWWWLSRLKVMLGPLQHDWRSNASLVVFRNQQAYMGMTGAFVVVYYGMLGALPSSRTIICSLFETALPEFKRRT